MTFSKFGIPTLVLLMLVWTVQTADNRIRLLLPQNSATTGSLQVFQDGTWGYVCDDSFDMTDASVACKQLGYDNAVTYSSKSDGNTVNIALDNLQCFPEDIALQDCKHNGWMVHNCANSEKIKLSCSGGTREILYELISSARHYWSCDYFTPGLQYDFRNGKNAVVYGTAIQERSAINSGFRLEGKSSWVNLGDFSSDSCLRDPSTCELTVSFWAKISKSTHHKTFLLGNRYDNSLTRGFSVYIERKYLSGYVLGSRKYCYFWRYRIENYYWFHFSMVWPLDGNRLSFKNGYHYGHRKCRETKNTDVFIENGVYTIGADETKAGNANRDLNVTFDEVAIWYSKLSDDDVSKPYKLVKDKGADSSINRLTIVLHDIPWSASYTDKSSVSYLNLSKATANQLQEIYNGFYGYNSSEMMNLEDRNGVLQMSLRLRFYSISWQHGNYLQWTLFQGEFLNSTGRILDCQSFLEFCSAPSIKTISPDGSGKKVLISYYPVPEHFNTGIFNGYFIYARDINGSYKKEKYHSPTTLSINKFHFELPSYRHYWFTMVAKSFYGIGFLYGNITYGYTIQAPPDAGPTTVNVSNVNPSYVTITWGNITQKINGIIRKFSATLYNVFNSKIRQIYVNVTEERTTTFEGLLAGKKYRAKVCGFTAHARCGTETDSRWFYTIAILPGKPPMDLTVLEVGHDKVHLFWHPVEWTSQNGYMEHYNLSLKNLRTNNFEVFMNYSIDNQGHTEVRKWVYDLKGLTQYDVYVTMVNEIGLGPAAKLNFTTNEGVPNQAPQNFSIQNVTADTIEMSWQLLDVENINGILLGYRLYYKNINLTNNWNEVDISPSAAAFPLTPVVTFHVYQLRLCGFTAVGCGDFTQTLVVFVAGKAPLNLPTEVNTLSITNDSMVIQWQYITPVERPAQFFTIIVTRNDTNKTVVKEVLDTIFWPGEVYNFTIRGLKEFKWYNIRMAAGNPAGVAPFLVDQVTNRTLEGVPSASPRNVTAVNDSSISMFLRWRPVLYEYADGVILGYLVYWRLAGSPGMTWQSLQVNGSVNTNVIVHHLEKFKDYEFKISAFNSVAESVATSPVVTRTDEDVPGHAPLNVIGHNTSSRSLEVTWEPVPAQWHHGIIRGYEVVIKDNKTTMVYKMTVSNTSLEVRGLERYSNYTIQVAAFTVKGNGNFSQSIITITDEDVPSEAPQDIVCLNTSSTSLSIRWSVLPLPKAHGIIRGYKIFLNRSDGQENTRMNIQTWDLTNTSFLSLDEFVNYTVQVLGMTIKGDGILSEPVNCLTDQDVPKDFPQNLHGYNTSDMSIKVLWQQVPSEHENGIITGYSLFYNTALRNGDVLYDSATLGTVMEHELTGLLPFQYYDIRVAASTSKGLGVKSVSVAIQTEEESPKIPPGDVKAFNTSSTSITLSWQLIPSEKVGGILRGYKIFWEEISYIGEVILQNNTRLDNFSVTSLSFSGLTKYQEYRFKILVFTKFDGVLSTPVSTLTDQDIPTAPPTNCSGFNMSKNVIKVMWDVVPRPERNGIIIGYNVYSDGTLNHVTFMKNNIKHHNLTVLNTTLAFPRSLIRDWLIPYTDYSFQVAALTSKGEGSRCDHFVVRTEEEAPRYPPGNLTVYNTSSTSLKVTWSGVNISLIRGIFHGYGISFTAQPQFPDAYLTYGDEGTRRKRRSAAFTLEKQLTTVDVGFETVEITGLAKYTNYSIQVMALSKFVGAQSISVQLITDEDKPGKAPQRFHGYNISSTSLVLKWSPVPDGFVHGILLGYRVYYRISIFPSMPLINVTYDATTLSSTLQDLLMFTKYTLQITALTSKGEGPYTHPIMVSTDEDVASKSPYGFKVITLIDTHEIPMTWHPVPNGFLNGILTGYRIKMRKVSEGMEDIDGKEIHFDVGPDTSSFTARNLPNFGTFTFQVVALTRYGEGVQSPVRVAKTCPCEKTLTTNWFPVPPYTNKTEDRETGIFPWLIDNMVTECCANCYNKHGWSTTLYKVDGKGADGFKYKMENFKNNIDDDTDFSFPVQGHALKEKYKTFYSYVFTVASPGVAFFIIDDPPDKMPNAILSTVSTSWSLLLFCVIFSFIAGIILWFLDTNTNEIEFPKQFSKGAGEGFWWAFISMTTVGYGDRSPQSIHGRLFAIFWILTGLVLTSILMGSITNALTTVTFSTKSIKLYGTKVAAIEGSPSHRIGIRRNAKINEDKAYNDAFEIQADLKDRKVKGALLDGYMAGSYNELFEDKRIRVHEIIDYKSGYGIVLGGQSKRLHKCFKIYVKTHRSYIIDHVAKEIKTVRKNPQSAAESLSTNLFNPKAAIFTLSISTVLGLLFVAIVTGLCLQTYFKRRFRNKVRDSVGTYDKQVIKELTELSESFLERMTSLKQELYNKHMNELRAMSGLKRRPVKYDILANLKETKCNSESELKFWCSKTQLVTPREISLVKLSEQSEKTSSMETSSSCSLAINLPTNNTDEMMDTEHCVENKPDINELQHEAYMAGLKPPGSDECKHPYAKMYRYLWVEK